ncbi:MAG: hypothetical protein KBD94_09050 [Pyrinomonadaceae bacterium]|nr:hypothetical protein [Pyrinomonadaceae bacterium]
MNRKLILALGFAALLCSTVSAQELLTRRITKTDRFDFGAGGTVAITGTPNGSIRVSASATNEIVITADIELQGRSAADLDRLANVTGFITDETMGRTAVVSFGTHNKLGDKKLWKKFPKTLLGLPFRIDYTITVPRYTDVEIDGGKGDLAISGVEGSIRVNFLDTNAKVEVIGGSSAMTFGSGKADVSFGSRGWRNRTATVQMATGDLTVHLASTASAQIDAIVLRTGKIENIFPDLKPRDRKTPFTDRAMLAKAGVGGAPMKFSVGDGTLTIKPLTLPF